MTQLKAKDRRILAVDDDPDTLEIICEALSWEDYNICRAKTGQEALSLISTFKPHLVVLDVRMPGLNGMETLKRLRMGERYTSVMFISGNTDSEAIIEGLDAGADDYIPKPFDPLEFLARVRTQLRIKDLNDQLMEANEKLKMANGKLQELAETDDLTGLFNMRSFYHKLDVELERARRFNRQVCVVMMDMDKFKSVNDGHDHLFGSFVLSEVGKIVAENIRNIDIGARYGGDEFIVILTETNADGAKIFCERLRKAIEKRHFKNGKDEMYLTSSIGFAITASGDQTLSAKALVRAADQALYEAKRAGRNCVKWREVEYIESENIPAVPDKKAV